MAVAGLVVIGLAFALGLDPAPRIAYPDACQRMTTNPRTTARSIRHSTGSAPQQKRDPGLLLTALKCVLHVSESQLHSVNRPFPPLPPLPLPSGEVERWNR